MVLYQQSIDPEVESILMGVQKPLSKPRGGLVLGSQGNPVTLNVAPGETRQYGLADVYVEGGDAYARTLAINWGECSALSNLADFPIINLILQFGVHGALHDARIDFARGGHVLITASRCRVILEVTHDPGAGNNLTGSVAASVGIGEGSNNTLPILTDSQPALIGAALPFVFGQGVSFPVPVFAKRAKFFLPGNGEECAAILNFSPVLSGGLLLLQPATSWPQWIEIPANTLRILCTNYNDIPWTSYPVALWEIAI